MKALHLLTVFFLLFTALCGCSDDRTTSLPVLRIGHAPHDHHSPLYIAAMNPDYFRSRGSVYLKEIIFRERYELISDEKVVAEVHISRSTGGKEIVRKLKEDQFDLCFGGVPAILHFMDEEADIRILAPVMSEGDGIFIGRELPVTDWDSFISHVRQQPKPVRIGYKIDFSVQNVIFEQALKEENISFSHDLDDQSVGVTLINLHGAENLLPALENGLIDGFVVNQPHLALAEHQNLGRTIAPLKSLPPHGRWEGIPCCAIAGNNEFIERHRKITTQLVTLFSLANQFIREQPGIAAEQVARWLDIPAEVEKRSLPTIRFNTAFDDTWHRGLEFWARIMLENGKIKGRIKEASKQDQLQATLYAPPPSKRRSGNSE